MTKAEIIKEIAKKTGIERAEVERIIETFMVSVTEHVANKQSVSFRGFGNFIMKKRAAKIARNITKNTTISLPAQYVPVFKPAKKFKDILKKVA